MSTFGDYANYYNLIYRDKTYDGEVAFVLDRLSALRPDSPATLLDLGCGTGRHAAEFARLGIDVTGVDLSDQMVALGNEELAKRSDLPLTPVLTAGDARTVRLGRAFDAVVSLFHVVNYQTTEEALQAQFETAAAHLKLGGLFLFDFWHGPGVIMSPPENRLRHFEDDLLKVQRTVRADHDLGTHRVDVHYDIDVLNKVTQTRSSFQETHRMRYWFLPELRYFAKQAGLTAVAAGAWLETREPTRDDWTAWMAVRR